MMWESNEPAGPSGRNTAPVSPPSSTQFQLSWPLGDHESRVWTVPTFAGLCGPAVCNSFSF